MGVIMAHGTGQQDITHGMGVISRNQSLTRFGSWHSKPGTGGLQTDPAIRHRVVEMRIIMARLQ